MVLFYVFFEGGLIPMFLIIGVWGGKRRIYASYKFFLYTFLGSVLMLVAIMAMYWDAGTSSIPELLQHKFPASMQPWLWFAFFASFAVKMPMWPVHTWLPDAHVEAPTAGSVILAGILLKLGGYGFLRFSLPMFPLASADFAPFVFTLSVVAIIYTSLVALMQEDIKKLIAYSSVAHMGFVTMGIFAANSQGVDGAIFQMLSHGLVSGALFLCVGVVYDRMHTREIAAYGGLVNRMPHYAVAMLIFTMANVGLPGTSGFVGEFLTLIGVFQANSWVAIFATTGVILSAAYALWLYRRVIFGALEKESLRAILDLSGREKILLYPLIALVIFFGVYPMPVFNVTSASVEQMLQQLYRGCGCRCARHFGRGGEIDARKDMTTMLAANARLQPSDRRVQRLIMSVGAMVLLMVGVFLGEKSAQTVTGLAVALIIIAGALAGVRHTERRGASAARSSSIRSPAT